MGELKLSGNSNSYNEEFRTASFGWLTLTEPGDCCSILDSKSRSIHMIILVEPISIAVHRATRQQPDNEQRLLGSNLSELGHNSLFIDLNLVFTYHHL